MRPADLRPLGDLLVNCDGDRLCKSCRLLFEAAQVLLEAGVEDEARIVPTLAVAARRSDLPVLARLVHEFSDVSVGSKAGQAPKTRFHNAFGPAEAEEVIGGVLIARREPFYVRPNLREKSGDPAEAVTIDVYSRSVEAEDLAGEYDRVLRNFGVPIDGLGRGAVSYSAYPGCLEILVRPEAPEMGGWEQMRARGLPRTEQPPFPPAGVVQGMYAAIHRSYKHHLPGRDGGPTFGSEDLVPACVAWYVGRRGRLVTEDRRRTVVVLDKHVFAPLERDGLETASSYKSQALWRRVKSAHPLIERVDSELETNDSNYSVLDRFS